MDIRNLLIEKICQGDRIGADLLLERYASEYGYERLLTEIVEPILTVIGEEWSSSETFTLSQMYVAAKVTEDVLNKIAEQRKISSGGHSRKRPAVIGNIEDDFHALGRELVGIFLRTEGWDVYDLGNDVPAEVFIDKAQEIGARVIGVSALMTATARKIIKVRKTIDNRGLTGQIQLAVGGAVFRINPDLVKEIGGDGTASNALGVSKLFDSLWERSLREEKSHE